MKRYNGNANSIMNCCCFLLWTQIGCCYLLNLEMRRWIIENWNLFSFWRQKTKGFVNSIWFSSSKSRGKGLKNYKGCAKYEYSSFIQCIMYLFIELHLKISIKWQFDNKCYLFPCFWNYFPSLEHLSAFVRLLCIILQRNAGELTRDKHKITIKNINSSHWRWW